MPYDSRPNTNKAFNEVSSDLAELMAKYKIKPLSTAMHTLGVVGSPLMVYFSAKGAARDASKGKYLDSAADIIPALPEIADVGIGTIAFTQALKQGAWQAGKVGVTRMGAGALGAGASIGASLFLTLAVDLGQTHLHELGYKVDNGMIGELDSKMNNIDRASLALFPTDTIPRTLASINAGTIISSTSTGQDQQDVIVQYDSIKSDTFGPETEAPSTPWHIDQRGINGFERELDQFTTYRGHYHNKALNDLAQAMYDNPDQAKGLFKDCLYATTISTALENAQKAGETINGKGQPLGATDLIPQKYLDAAAKQVLDGFRQDYKAADAYYNVYHKELGQFATFYGHYERIELNTLAKDMYEHKDQADTLFGNYMRTTIKIQALEDAKAAGVKNSDHHTLTWTDNIPDDYVNAAEKKVYTAVEKDYQQNAMIGYVDNALNYIDPRGDRHYTDPKNLGVTRIECARVLMTFNDGKGGVFHWDNPEHVRLMRGMLDQALLIDQRSTLNAHTTTAHPSHKAVPAVAPLKTRLNEEQIHGVNQNIIDQIVDNNLEDKNTHSFDPKKLALLQNQLVQAGYLSPTYQTGTMNGFTMRAIESAIKAESNPSSITPDQLTHLVEKADATLASLKEIPADPSTFDPRALSFQTNTYLLGLYDGHLDGLSGPKTAKSMEKFEQLQKSDTGISTFLPISAIVVAVVTPPTP